MTKNRTVIGLRSKDRGIIYEGSHFTIRDAMNDAVETRVDLSGVDLSGKDLRGINLDGIDLANANFAGSDLTDANLSEARFTNCDFSAAALFDTCFCYSDLESCCFQDSRFGLTDFAAAKIRHCIFAGLSAFSLKFVQAQSLSDTVYRHGNASLAMSLPPYILQGFKYPLIFLDDKILIDGTVYDFDADSLIEFSDFLFRHLIGRNSRIG